MNDIYNPSKKGNYLIYFNKKSCSLRRCSPSFLITSLISFISITLPVLYGSFAVFTFALSSISRITWSFTSLSFTPFNILLVFLVLRNHLFTYEETK